MAEPALDDLPLFPLNTVLFPGGVLPLRVFETRYMDMTRECLKAEQPFGVCLIRTGKEVGAPATPEPVGSLATIAQWDMQQLGVLQLRTLGGQRFRIRDASAAAQGLLRARVELIPDEEDADLPEQYTALADLLRLVIADKSEAVFAEPHALGSALWVGYRLSEILPVPLAAKQKLLELDGALARLEILYRFLEQRGLVGGRA
ncbi:MAG: LON peptidase substrate-binding domain-containing protein [Burkholderiales bacterium]